MLGGDCSFLGFPYGGGWLANMPDGHKYWMPYVKHCTVSSMPSTEPPRPFWTELTIRGFQVAQYYIRPAPIKE